MPWCPVQRAVPKPRATRVEGALSVNNGTKHRERGGPPATENSARRSLQLDVSQFSWGVFGRAWLGGAAGVLPDWCGSKYL
jgi:hypothetical protein